ncbi:MAG: tetratricopeptide repeat protein [Melioribacteraceae bacterium]|nr:tetratricopeptide repeat protein [Melioribacteraceae bacterium]
MKFSLAWAYLNENLWEEAESLIEELNKRYPESLRAKILFAAYLENIDEKKSLQLYNTILSKYDRANKENPKRNIELNYKIAELNFKLSNYEKSLEICEHFIQDADTNKAYYSNRKLNIDEFVKLRDTLNTAKTALPEN